MQSIFKIGSIIFGVICLLLGVGLLFWSWGNTADKVPLEFRQLSPSLGNQISISPTPTPTPKPLRILFGGDLMFDRHIRQKIEKSGADFILSPLSDLFATYDLAIANLEGPVTDKPSKSVNSEVGSTNNYIFTFSPEILPMLYRFKLRLLNLGNNHILNFGQDGLIQTRQHLTQYQIDSFGNSGTEATSSARVFVNLNTQPTLAFVNYNQFVNDGFATALEDVKYAVSLAEVVIVMPHWGIEYEPRANNFIQRQAHQLIDAGADLIIGGHPHVVQQSEVFLGKSIYYSLGNFVFDQYFEPAVQQGLLIGVEIYPDQTIKVVEIPIVLDKNGQTRLSN